MIGACSNASPPSRTPRTTHEVVDEDAEARYEEADSRAPTRWSDAVHRLDDDANVAQVITRACSSGSAWWRPSDTVRAVSYSGYTVNYCPTCQTGGKVLTDKRDEQVPQVGSLVTSGDAVPRPRRARGHRCERAVSRRPSPCRLHRRDVLRPGLRTDQTTSGMLGITGTFEGRPISVQSTGMGCPSAGIVFEELIQLGARRLIRVGTCGGLSGIGLRLADTVVALSATCEDTTPLRYADCPGWAAAATFGLVEAAVRLGRETGATVRVGPVVTSSLFYDPDLTNVPLERLGHLGLEMEAGMLYTVAAVHTRGSTGDDDRERHRRVVGGRARADQRCAVARGCRRHDPRTVRVATSEE